MTMVVYPTIFCDFIKIFICVVKSENITCLAGFQLNDMQIDIRYGENNERNPDFQGIDFHGRVIGSRKKGKSKREMREKANKGQLIKISEHKDDPHSLKLASYLYHNISIGQKSTGNRSGR